MKRGPRYQSRRYFHERTGEPMPAYVIDGFVVEKARRDWDARPFRGTVGNPTSREWWEVRRQGARTQPGVSLGDALHEASTLRECIAWIEAGDLERELLSIDESLRLTRDPGIRRNLAKRRREIRRRGSA